LVAGAFCFVLLAIGRVPSRDTHESILTTLRAIDANHASLQRDVLRARSGLLKNYDPLVKSIVALHAAVTELRALFPQSGVEDTGELDTHLSRLENAIDADEKLVERFKTDNALLQNSLSLANQILSELHNSSDPVVTDVMRRTNDLGNLMMRFAAEPQQRFAERIWRNLLAIRVSEASRNPQVSSYVAHAELILDTLPSVDHTIDAIQASQTSLEAQKLQTIYLDAYGLINIRASWSRILLGVIAGFLCLYIATLVYRLRTQTYRLTQQLDFENLIGEIRERFAGDPTSIDMAASHALQRLARFFEAERFAFAVVDSETGQIRRWFDDADDPAQRAVVERFSEQAAISILGDHSNRDRFLYNNLRQRGIQALPEGALSAGSIAAASIDPTTFGVLLLRHSHVRRKPNSDEVRLRGQAVLVLVQNLRSHGERLSKEVLEARLEHSERLEAVGTLAGGIAHEFNNALGAILGYGEMALQLRGTSARTRRYVQEIVASGERAKHIIDQILTFSRKRERISKPFDVREAVEEIVPLVRLSMPGAVNVSIDVTETLPAVFGNPIEIQQVIMNLCKNAADAMQDNGHIEISAHRIEITRTLYLSHGELPPGGYVLLRVSDDGIGIQKSVLPHIFEPFFTTKSAKGGTGLGLAAVHGHVTGMKGKIDVSSLPGNGTRFSLYFPHVRDEPVPLAQFFNERTTPLGKGEVVLIGQPDTNLRLMYEEKIAALGYEPVGFARTDELKDWIRKNGKQPDLILLDLHLWPELPDWRSVTAEFAPCNILFMTEPELDGIDPRLIPEVALLRKPVSSVALATALFNGIGVCHLPSDARL
jgi:signal transduction histidine kinase